MFHQAKPVRAFEVVAEQIQDAIFAGKVLPGEKLPSERELIKVFGISRRTLREAMRVLEQKSLIEVRTGIKGGAVVRGPNTEQMSDSLATLIRYQKASLEDLAEFRIDIESDVAARAAKNAQKNDLLDLKKLLSQEAALLEKKEFDWKTFLDLDRQIHQKVASAARNSFHEFVLNSIHDNIHRYYETYLPNEKPVSARAYQDMVELIEAIENKDAEKAAQIAAGHVRHGWEFMKRRIESTRDGSR